MSIAYTKNMLIERITKHLVGNFPGEDWKVTSNETLLYIDEAIPVVMKGQMFENAKMTGFLDVPEAYLLTYELPITTRNNNTKEWYVSLPQPPLALPTGYDITRTYVASPSTGASQNGFPIKAKRVPYRDYMPKPSGFSYRLEGKTMFLSANDGSSLYDYNLYVQMPISRTADKDAAMYMPDDAIEMVFNKVVGKILQRYNIPHDIVKDNLPPGNKTS
jgi:hypothetical protein